MFTRCMLVNVRQKGAAALAAGFTLNLPTNVAAAQGYVRVGISAALASEIRFLDVDCESTMPAAIYGCGEGGDGARFSTVGEFGTTAGLALGAGYALGSATRVELQVEYRPAVPFTGRTNFLAPTRANVTRHSVGISVRYGR